MILQRNILINKLSRRICRKLYARFASTESKGWKPSIGLEIHAQINSNSKLFSAAPVSFASPVNTCVSLFDCAIPGTMPVLNRKCVEAGVLTALALNCELNECSMFERKHYFYADLPAGFQITQQKHPLAKNGRIEFYVTGPQNKIYSKSSKLKQIQLEQDSGKSLHFDEAGKVLIDLNRAGVPLMEFVFEPDLVDGEEAAALVKELSIVLKLLNTCSCKMEEGAFRVDANVSVSQLDGQLGTRTEIKNIFSVRAVAAAVKYEIERQIKILESGGKVTHETLTWDTETKSTILMREKEESKDYRFMPETNLPPLYLHMDEGSENKYNLVDVPDIKKKLPELPEHIRNKLQQQYGLTFNMISLLVGNLRLLDLFYEITRDNPSYKPQNVALFIAKELLTFLYKYKLDIDFCFQKEKKEFICELIGLSISKKVTQPLVTAVLDLLHTDTGKTPTQIVEEMNWYAITDDAEIEAICKEAITTDPRNTRRAKAGKERSLNALVAQVMKLSDRRVMGVKALETLKKLLAE